MRRAKISIINRLLVFIFILVGCTSKKNPQTLTSFTFSDLFNKCLPNAHYSLKPIIDTSNRVKISLPETWEIQMVNDSNFTGFSTSLVTILQGWPAVKELIDALK